MVPFLVLCLLSPLLVASADPPPLKCVQSLKDPPVSDCDKDLNACVVIKDESTIGISYNTTVYDCGKRSSCANAFAITIGKGRYLHHSSACCAEDECNKDLDWGALPTPWKENGHFCEIGCYAQTEADCTEPVTCTDGQMSCISTTGISGARKFILKGCGTSNMCNVMGFELKIGGILYKMDNISCDAAKPTTTAKPTTPTPATPQKSAITKKPATSPKTTKTTSEACTHHILGKNSFLLLLPSISSILFMKFLS